MMNLLDHLAILMLLKIMAFSDGFLFRGDLTPFGVAFFNPSSQRLSSCKQGMTIASASMMTRSQLTEENLCHRDNKTSASITSPLKYVGPYPCLSLRFPSLSTRSQRQRNVTGVSLDFVLDTAANTNTINAGVAAELSLEVVGKAPAGLGAGGAISGGATFLLGECQVEGVRAPLNADMTNEDLPSFLTGLTASALPVASPAAAGLLGAAFFNTFRGGVEFKWDKDEDIGGIQNGQEGNPSVTFYADQDHVDGCYGNEMERAMIKQHPDTYLPTVMLTVNGEEFPALLDTGSPITVLNQEAAKMAGVVTVDHKEDSGGSLRNPLANIAQTFKTAQAAARGDVLALAGANGQRIELLKSSTDVIVTVGNVDMGSASLYVGEMPGLAALGAIGGASAPPAAVLGLDILRRRRRMIYRVDEVLFSA